MNAPNEPTLPRYLYGKVARAGARKWLVFLLCLVVSALVWFTRQMGKTYTLAQAVPLSVEYDRRRFVPLEPLPERIEANVTGQGWPVAIELFRLRSAPLRLKAGVDADGSWRFSPTWAQRQLQSRFSAVRVNYVAEDDRIIRFDSVITRSVQVWVKPTGGGRKLWRGQVCYYGPSHLLDSLPKIHRRDIKPSDVHEGHVNLPSSSLFSPAWLSYLCAGQRGGVVVLSVER